ncbi:MAG: cation-transporting P-type ATPase, partial [Anaerolineae bacterium]|nr:cation-transporting P-type ATPase [Anaerolineae bacterium]
MASDAEISIPSEPDDRTEEDYYILPPDNLLNQLATSPKSGLSAAEVAKRHERYGFNQLDEAPPVSFWAMLWEQFNNFVVILLVAAAVISAVLGEYIEAGAILAIVVLNAGL